MKSDLLRYFARTVPYGSVPWFDLLDRMGLLSIWCQSENKDVRTVVLRLFLEPNVLAARAERIAELIEPAIHQGGPKRDDMLQVFKFGDFARSPKLIQLFLQLIDEGAFDDDDRHWDTHLHAFATINPTMAAHVIARVLDRDCLLAAGQGLTSPFQKRTGPSVMRLPQGMVGDAATMDPGTFAEQIVPRIVRIIRANEVVAEDGETQDRAWPFRAFGTLHSFKDSLLTSSAFALARIAAQNPNQFDQIAGAIDNFPHQNIAYLLLTGWEGNCEHYADHIIDYVVADPHRLTLGYSIWSAGDGILAISRAAIQKASLHCTDDRFRALETILLNFYPKSEKNDPRAHGYSQYLLLTALPPHRLSATAASRLKELVRKFPGSEFEEPYVTDSGGFVGSPIPKEAAEKMSDAQWLSAMRKYGPERARPTRRDDFRKGSGIELSRILEEQARQDKPRFASLALQMGEELPPIYFEALLRGLSGEERKQPPTSGTEPPPPSVLEDNAFNQVIVHVNRVAGPHVGRWLCDAIANHAEHNLPTNLLAILSTYAISDPNPQEDSWNKSVNGMQYYGGNPLDNGINTTRGTAANAIARLLFADRTRFQFLKPAIESLSHDPSVAVRSVAVEVLVALLNIDRNLAVKLFLDAVTPNDAILDTHTVDQFLHYAIFSHYSELKPLLLRMLTNKNDDVKGMAAQKIALAAFSIPAAEEDLKGVLGTDAVCRAAVAKIDAVNFPAEECRSVCRERLLSFFADSDKKVRDSAAGVIHNLSPKLLSSEVQLVNAFFESPAFQDHVHFLLDALEKSDERLPELVCRLAERAVTIQLNGESANRWWTNDIGRLVLRLYDQTRDAALQKRCLDLIDQMIELGFGNVDPALLGLDRS